MIKLGLISFGVILSALIIWALVTVLCIRLIRSWNPGERWCLKVLGLSLLWGLVICRIHGYPQEHRLLFDEDAYGNMAVNVLFGYGASITTAFTSEVKHVERYKWPAGFPTLAAPLVACLGPERGLATFNECCGALTVLLVAVFACRLSGSITAGIVAGAAYGLHPVVGGWHRSNSAEPLAVLLAVLCFWAATEAIRSRSPNDWALVAIMAALFAVNVRWDGVLLGIPLVLLLRNTRIVQSRRAIVILLLAGFPLLADLVPRAATLARFYLSQRPESRFSLSFAVGNAGANFAFLAEFGPWPFVLPAIVGLCWLAWIPGPFRTTWQALLLWLVVHFSLLTLYSVGQYRAPGGSRFLLFPLAALAVAGASILQLRTHRYRARLGAALLLVFSLYSLTCGSEIWISLNALYASAHREHEAIRRWSRQLPSSAVVVSPLPYIWEAFGTHSVSTSYLSQPLPGVTHYHLGLFNPSPLQGDTSVVDEVATMHGNIVLYRLP
ncbi:MAG: glycosyltransferase family 39 protein [Acidobacteria bacterium]|nr:glycosyltransferase family 39 protein [Acidobacteriota bacterium]